MPDTNLYLPDRRRQVSSVDPSSASVLQRLKSLSNVGSLSNRGLDIATNADEYAPTEAELIQEQLSPMTKTGGGTYETPGGYTGSISRDLLRESGAQQFKRKLRALGDQYIVPEQIKGAADLQKQGMVNAGNLATERLKGENASATAAVPRTVNTNTTTNVGSGAGAAQAGGQQLYGSMLSRQAVDAASDLMKRANSMSTGLGGQLLQYPGSTQAHAFKTDLEFLKGNLISKALNEMRSASKTGGALGQVSDYENRILSNIYGNIDQFNSADKVKGGLQQVIDSLNRWETAKQKYGAGASVDEAAGPMGTGVNTTVDPFGLGF